MKTKPENFTFRLAFRDGSKDDAAKRSKVRLLPIGPMVYRGKPLDFTLADLQEIMSETKRLISNCKEYAKSSDGTPDRKAWTPPIMIEHIPNGDRKGDAFDFEILNGELFATCNWRESAWAAILAEEYEFVSVQVVGPYVDFKGVEYKRVVWEVSLTGQPVRKDIGRIQDTMTLADVPPNLEEIMEEQIKELLAALEAMKAEHEALLARIAELEAFAAGTPKTEEAEAAAAMAEAVKAVEMTKLSEAVAALAIAQKGQALAMVALSEKAPRITNEIGNGGSRPSGSETSVKARAAAAKAAGKSGLESLRDQILGT